MHDIYDSPMVVAIDIQREYTTPGRPFFLRGIDESLENCAAIIAHARCESWPIVHVRHVQDGHVFNEQTPFGRFVEGFEPRGSEMLFSKDKLSCYSNKGFAELMQWARSETVYVIGYNSIMCCLSTLVEAFHRGHRLNFVTDASLAKATAHASEDETHRIMTDVISIYANVVRTEDVIGVTGHSSEDLRHAV